MDQFCNNFFFYKKNYIYIFRYHTDPSGTFTQFDAKAIGAGSEGANTTLQEKYNKVNYLFFFIFQYLTIYLKVNDF